MTRFVWPLFSFFKTKSNTVTLCSLKTKQKEAESLAAVWVLMLGMLLAAAVQQRSCRATTCG